MTRTICLFLMSVAWLGGQQTDLQLPEWEEEDLEALESGELVPGSSLLGSLARAFLTSDLDEPIELDPAVRDLPEEDPEPEEWSRVIQEQFLSAYFKDLPKGYLNDPQQLLTTQEFRDREGFLNYHARDTDIDVFIYVFDALQEIPEGESISKVTETFFEEDAPVAVVFYHLGMPEKSQLAFSRRVLEAVSEEDRKKVLRLVIEEALEKSDPISQLESFSIQLSISLYQLEKLVGEGGGSLTRNTRLILPQARILPNEERGIWDRIKGNSLLFYIVVVFAVLGPAVLLGLAGRWIAERKRSYVFPDAEGSPLLGAPHAAGVGGVISFSSATAPPSSQKSDVPDYLQKM